MYIHLIIIPKANNTIAAHPMNPNSSQIAEKMKSDSLMGIPLP